MTNRIITKGIMTIDRMDSKWVPFYIDFDLIETNNEEYYGEDEILCMETDTLPLPDAAYDLEVGESVEVEVEFELLYTKDYWGEIDIDIEYTHQRKVNG